MASRNDFINSGKLWHWLKCYLFCKNPQVDLATSTLILSCDDIRHPAKCHHNVANISKEVHVQCIESTGRKTQKYHRKISIIVDLRFLYEDLQIFSAFEYLLDQLCLPVIHHISV